MKFLLKQSALTLLLAAMSLEVAYAVVPVSPAGRQIPGAITLQGGSNSSVKYTAPATSTYKVHVLVPIKTRDSVVNALYRVYPKGELRGSAACISTDAQFPCYEVTVDQTQHSNEWAQLMLNNDTETQWAFVRGKGFVTAVASNLSAADKLHLSASVSFENPAIAIGKTYQGGIIFYINNSGQHGLIAAPTDQSTGIRWFNGSYSVTEATGMGKGQGQANTTAIVSNQGAGSYAAKLCDDLVIGAYKDWYLPSKVEQSMMYSQIGAGASGSLKNIGGFANASYWSSTESDFFYAWFRDFTNGNSFALGKENILHVRAVRAF